MILRKLATDAVADSASIDLTPIIDMVFLLLVFFLAATTFQRNEREMKIALPETQAAAPITAMLKEFVINVDRDGRAIMGGATLSDAALGTRLVEAVERQSDQKVVVRGDRNATYASIARVLDLCKKCGVAQPYLETQPTN